MRFIPNIARPAGGEVRGRGGAGPERRASGPSRRSGAATVVAVALVSVSCVTEDGGDTGRPRVVVTTTVLGDIVADVAGPDAEVDVLMPIGADPHEFSLSVRQAAAMQEADLLVVNGLGFEAGLSDAIEAASSGGVPTLDLGEQLDARPPDGPTDEDREGGEAHDEGEDHDHDGAADPHWFTDPVRMARAATLVGDALVEDAGADPSVASRAAQVEGDLLDLDEEIAATLEVIPTARRLLVTNHEVFGYFADRYGLTVVDVVVPGGTTLSAPGSAELADLVENIEAAGVGAIFVETSAASDLAEAVADEVDRPVDIVELFTESLGVEGSGGETYIDMMRTDAGRIAEALG